jgi:hypothetical protein
MTEDRPSSAHQARASVEADAPPGHLCVNQVLLHAGGWYWGAPRFSRRGKRSPVDRRRCQPIQTTLKMRISLADPSTWNDKIPNDWNRTSSR